MSEQMDKQEAATPFKLEEARKKGQVGRSPELTGFAMLVTLLAGLLGVFPHLAAALAERTAWWLSNASMLAKDSFALQILGARSVDAVVVGFLAPIVIAGVVITVVVAFVHAGPVWSFFTIKPDFNRLNPATGFKRVFSRKNLVDTLKLIFKLLVFAAVFVLLWPRLSGGLAATLDASPMDTAGRWFELAKLICLSFLAVFAVFALFDLWFTKREFARQMRMSRRDLKDEHKRREGDPEIRTKRRRNQVEFMRRLRALSRIKDADVIVTNPTHVAVALRYRPKETPLPITIALGQGMMAQAVLALARRHRIPVVRRPPLARALYKQSSPGAAIPIERQHDVAAIYRWVISLPGCKVLA